MEKKASFASAFYHSWTWTVCAKKYSESVGGLCERCAKAGKIVPGEQVHHKIRLTPENLNDPAISLNWDNLELLCRECHLEEHKGTRWRTDDLGHVTL